jgi:hypothetical protein
VKSTVKVSMERDFTKSVTDSSALWAGAMGLKIRAPEIRAVRNNLRGFWRIREEYQAMLRETG